MPGAAHAQVRRRFLPLVGRDAELELIDAALGDLEIGIGSVVTLAGEPGIGATRLIDESCRRAAERGLGVVRGAGWDGSGAMPWWPWDHIVDQLGGLGVWADVSTRFGRFRSVAAAMSSASRAAPLLVVVDDLHLLDLDALSLTHFLVRSFHGAPVMFLFGAHDAPERTRAALADVVRAGSRLQLQPLDAQQLDELVDLVGGPAAAVPRDELARLTGGRPLLVDEALSALADGEDIWIGSVVERRLAHLDRPQRRTLLAAALVGRLDDVTTLMSVTGQSARELAATLSAGRAAGVLVDRPGPARAATELAWLHPAYAEEVVRSAQTQARAEVDELRRRVAEALERSADGRASTVELRVAAAEHRIVVAQASGSSADRAAAARAATVAAGLLHGGHAHRAGAELLARTIELYDEAPDSAPVGLVAAAGRSALTAGDLRSARRWFAEVAASAADASTRAEALLGLGGIWVHEVRSAIEHEAYLTALHRSVAEMAGVASPGSAVLRARLDVRAAAERAYSHRGRVDAVRRAVDVVRGLGDLAARAEALSLLHHCLLAPGNADERLAVADELIRTAAEAGDDLWSLLGVMWRAVDLVLVGDRRADRALAELSERGATIQVGAVDFVIAALGVMRLIRAGRIAEAEAAAQECFHLGTTVGDADAFAYYGSHMMVIRWLQGRSAEILPLAHEVAASPTVIDDALVFDAGVAAVAADAGQVDVARAALGRVLDAGVQPSEISSTWLMVLFGLAEAAEACADTEAAATVSRLLAPYADRPLTGSLGVVCLGSAERSLGLAARTLGDLALAEHHFARAAAASSRFGNLPMAAIARVDLAVTILRDPHVDDVRRHAALDALARASDELHGMGLDVRATRARDIAGEHRSAPRPAAGTIETVGDRVRIVWAGASVTLPDSVGVRRLVELLRNPGRPVPAVVLLGGAAMAGAAMAGADGGRRPAGQAVLDRAALQHYRRRIDELRNDIEEASGNADIGTAEALHVELEAVLDEVRRHTGLGQRPRDFTDADERARIAVQKSIRRVLDRVVALAPVEGSALAACIHTGSMCRFEPVGVPDTWELRTCHEDVTP